MENESHRKKEGPMIKSNVVCDYCRGPITKPRKLEGPVVGLPDAAKSAHYVTWSDGEREQHVDLCAQCGAYFLSHILQTSRELYRIFLAAFYC